MRWIFAVVARACDRREARPELFGGLREHVGKDEAKRMSARIVHLPRRRSSRRAACVKPRASGAPVSRRALRWRLRSCRIHSNPGRSSLSSEAASAEPGELHVSITRRIRRARELAQLMARLPAGDPPEP